MDGTAATKHVMATSLDGFNSGEGSFTEDKSTKWLLVRTVVCYLQDQRQPVSETQLQKSNGGGGVLLLSSAICGLSRVYLDHCGMLAWL